MINEYIEFKKFLDNLKLSNIRPKLLVHVCCGPCASYCLDLLNKYFDISILYYNPNTYPVEEYNLRKDELVKLLDLAKYNINILEVPYNHEEYLNAVKGVTNLPEGSKRCYNCYDLRIKKLAETADDYNFDYYTTVMSVSPYKNSLWINELGKKYENKSKYLYSNFKKENGYRISIEMSKEYNLYRQDYCGCEFSKNEHEIKMSQKEKI